MNPPLRMPALSAGDRLGSYEILAPLGAGGMGEVFVARDSKLGRKVAIKVLHGDRHPQRDSLQRFAEEARAASALNHPNIITIYDVNLDGAIPYISMEYIDGRTLREEMNEARLSIRRVLQLASQAADGLAAAHAANIVHRDLKPENIMITRDGYLKIVDFGLASQQPFVSDENEETFEIKRAPTRTGTVLGTVGYMSPEQANGASLDFRSDQFSFGAILYEMVTARRAFRRSNPLDTLSAIVHDEPESIIRLNPKVPAPLRWIIDRCLAKLPEERYASTLDLARELRTLRDRIAETTATDEAIAPPPVWRERVGRVSWIAVATAASLLVIGGAVSGSHSSEGVRSYSRNVVVEPFRELTPAAGQLGAGLAESIATRLASVDRLRVLPVEGARSEAGMLGASVSNDADLLVRGAVQRDEHDVRITWAVVQARDGLQIAADAVTGKRESLFRLQDQVADGIASALTLRYAAKAAPPAAASEDRYLQALGELRRYDDLAAINQAVTALRQLLTEEPSARMHAALGRACMARYVLTHDGSDSQCALAETSKATLAEPSSPSVLAAAAEVALHTGHYEPAAALFQRLSAIRPDDASALEGKGEALEYMGRSAEAEAAYRKAIALRPRYWAGYNKLGAFLALHGRVAEAVHAFSQVRVLVPESIRGMNNLGAAYEQQGRFDDAIVLFRQSLAAQPSADAYSNLGTCLYYKGDYEQAAAAYQHAADLAPLNYVHWSNLGDAARRMPTGAGRAAAAYGNAIARLRDELRLNPENAAARGVLAVCLARSGEAAAAEREIQQAMQSDPSSVTVAYQSSIVAALRDDRAAARLRLNSAIQRGYASSEAKQEPDLNSVLNSVVQEK